MSTLESPLARGLLKAIYHHAIQLLSRREHSKTELRQKLGRKYTVDDIDDVIEYLAEQGLQSDARFADSFTRSRSCRGHGPLRVKHDLQQRGVSADLISDALSHIDWQQVLIETKHKKYGEHPPTDWDTQQRQTRFLAQRGFPLDLIKSIED